MSVYDCILIIRSMTKMCVVEHIMFILITQLVSTQSFAPQSCNHGRKWWGQKYFDGYLVREEDAR